MASKPRSIFEEVDTTVKQEITTGGIDAKGRGARKGIRAWLFALFALVAVMIAVGGLTRLTDSGLSITEWAPVSGAMPPISAEAWDLEFEKYRQIPEYQEQNKGMTLSEFKFIYWWEWGHRQLGRFIGLVWFAGFIGFAVTRNIPTGWTPKLLFLGALGGLQGFIGWWMVSSGLEEGMLDVASYRLATHLGLAFVIFGFIAWYGFFPPDPFTIEPLWRNFFEDAGLVQFMHRMAGYVLFGLGIYVWMLGIVTVVYSAPWQIAIVHQFGAVVLWVLVLRARFLASYPLPQSVRGETA